MCDLVRCPECDALQRDLWDYDFGSREEMAVDCGSCGADYLLVRRVSVDYEARRLSPKHQ